MTERRLFCPECGRNVLARQDQAGQAGELFVILFTFGLALPLVFLSRVLTPRPFLCPRCGLTIRPARSGAEIVGLVVVAVAVTITLIGAAVLMSH